MGEVVKAGVVGKVAPLSVDRTAAISTCEQYRYHLTRVWNPERPMLGWVMLNPSTADADKDDATIRKCMGFARRLACGGISVVNLFAFRTKSPAELKRAAKSGIDVAGPDNDRFIEQWVKTCPVTIAAWGAHGRFQNRDLRMRLMLRDSAAPQLYYLRRGMNGVPHHPLYIPYEEADRLLSQVLLEDMAPG